MKIINVRKEKIELALHGVSNVGANQFYDRFQREERDLAIKYIEKNAVALCS